jgi:hypothetical protein
MRGTTQFVSWKPLFVITEQPASCATPKSQFIKQALAILTTIASLSNNSWMTTFTFSQFFLFYHNQGKKQTKRLNKALCEKNGK